MELDCVVIFIVVEKNKCISIETKKTKNIVCNKDSHISQLFFCKF